MRDDCSKELEIAALKTLVDHYQKLAEGDTCLYDGGECDAKVALRVELANIKSLVREMAKLLSYRSDGVAHEILNRPQVKVIMEEE